MPFKKGETPPGAILFQPGKSGNPEGRPKTIPELDVLLADVYGDNDQAKEIITSLHKQAKKGNVRAAEVLLDRIYGKVKQPLEHSGELNITDARSALLQKLGKRPE